MIIIALGSNLGESRKNLEFAIEKINSSIGSVKKRSNIYCTPPMGFSAENDFLNMCISIDSELSPNELLEKLLALEIELGRKRDLKTFGYQSRSIDLDIIAYNGLIIDNSQLSIPHPKLEERNFVLYPIQDIDSQWVNPRTGKTVKEMIAHLGVTKIRQVS